MSLNKPANKEELKEFCLRQLGYPVVQINVDDEQVNDAVELALSSGMNFILMALSVPMLSIRSPQQILLTNMFLLAIT